MSKSHATIPVWNKVRLREIMRDRKLSAADIGRMLGYERQTVGHWLRGRGDPSLKDLTRLANELGIQVAELIDPNALIANTGPERAVIEAMRSLSDEDAARLAAFADALKTSK